MVGPSGSQLTSYEKYVTIKPKGSRVQIYFEQTFTDIVICCNVGNSQGLYSVQKSIRTWATDMSSGVARIFQRGGGGAQKGGEGVWRWHHFCTLNVIVG